MNAQEYLNTALGGNMNIGTLKPKAFEEIMADYAKHKLSKLNQLISDKIEYWQKEYDFSKKENDKKFNYQYKTTMEDAELIISDLEQLKSELE